jgi:pimeloyl-ACP methyl ester carboxylesterase
MDKVTSKDGTLIAFDRSGDGPAMIMVGGALSERSAGAPLAALLAPHFTVFTYDRRGRGDSGDTLPYAVQHEVEDLEAILQEAGGAAFVFGHSSGAALALEATGHLSAKIKKLAVYEPPYMVAAGDPKPPADHLAQLKALLAQGRRGDAVAYFMTTVVGMPAEAVAPMRRAPMWPGLEALAHTLVYDVIVMGDYSFPRQRVAAVTTPILALDGGASPAWAHHAAQAIADTAPHAQRHTLDGQTHGAAPEVIAPVLQAFFGSQ